MSVFDYNVTDPGAPKKDKDSSNPVLKLATIQDRAAAFLLDTAILTMAITLLVAPFRKNLMYAVLNENLKSYIINLAIIILVSLGTIIFYHTFFIYLKGATIGKMVFRIKVVNLWSQKAPSLTESFVRAVAWFFSVLPVGLPFLEIFSNSQRRPLHDRINDTTVISLSEREGVAPSIQEKTLVRSIYAFCLGVIAIILAVQVKMYSLEFSNMNDFLGFFSDSDIVCESVSEAQDKWPLIDNEKESRLNIALTLYASDLIDEECLDIEARRAFYFDEDHVKAYLAKAFSTSEDSQLSDNYLKKVCEEDENSESCDLTKIIVLWTEKKWEEAEEIFKKLSGSKTPYVKIWEIKHHEKNKNYTAELDVIDELWPNEALVAYLGTHSTIALWGAHRKEESRQAFMGVYNQIPEEQKETFSAWMCDLELEESCYYESNGCQAFNSFVVDSDVAALEISSSLTHIKALACQPEAASSLSVLKDKIEDPNIFNYVKALEAKLSKNNKEALKILNELHLEIQDEPQFAFDVNSQRIELAKDASDLSDLAQDWHRNEGKTWYWLKTGYKLFNKYNELKQFDIAAEIGQDIFALDPLNHFLKEQLVVTLYKSGDVEGAQNLLNSTRSKVRGLASQDEFLEISRKLKEKNKK